MHYDNCVNDKDVDGIMPNFNVLIIIQFLLWRSYYQRGRKKLVFVATLKDLVVGRHGYGINKFLGETDVGKLDLDSAVQFNHREVIIYMDESKKPPVGLGLNKPAEITLSLMIDASTNRLGRSTEMDQWSTSTEIRLLRTQ